MSDNGPILVAQKVRKEFGGLVAVNDVDFEVPRGKVVSLIGPNGAGKTTFFNMLTGVYKPTAGKITFLGEDVTGKPPHAITARGVGRTFQNIRLFQNMTALENVLVGMHARLKANLFVSILRTPGVKREELQARERVRRPPGHVIAVEEHETRRRLVHAGEHVEERRLAGAVRPDEADDRGARHVEGHIVDRDEAAELLPQPIGVEKRRAGVHGVNRSSCSTS
jgi:ABC-type branched-subunit amino acid transport system ATPase component